MTDWMSATQTRPRCAGWRTTRRTASISPRWRSTVGHAVAYRDDGTLKKSTTGTPMRSEAPEGPGRGNGGRGPVRMDLAIQVPPEPVRAAIEQLCPDAAYLGTHGVSGQAHGDQRRGHPGGNARPSPRCQASSRPASSASNGRCLVGLRNSRLRTGRRAEDRRRLRRTVRDGREVAPSQTPVPPGRWSSARHRPAPAVPLGQGPVVPRRPSRRCRIRSTSGAGSGGLSQRTGPW